MKKLFFFCAFVLSLIGARAQSANITLDSLQKRHAFLMQKSRSFLARFMNTKNYTGMIDQRVNKTQSFIPKTPGQVDSLKLAINLLRLDVAFYGETFKKSDSLRSQLVEHEKYIRRELDPGNFKDKLEAEDEVEIVNVQDLSTAAKDAQKSAKKTLDRLYVGLGRAEN